MSNEKNDGWPVSPIVLKICEFFEDDKRIITQEYNSTGMTIRQYAAIHLQQPDSGIDWLDDMIRKAKRDAIAGQAMQAILSSDSFRRAAFEIGKEKNISTDNHISMCAYDLANAMLAEINREH